MILYLLSSGQHLRHTTDGALAQLVEHIVHIDGVTGSSPVSTTKKSLPEWEVFSFAVFYGTKPVCPIDMPAAHRWGAKGPSSRLSAPPVADEARALHIQKPRLKGNVANLMALANLERILGNDSTVK